MHGWRPQYIPLAGRVSIFTQSLFVPAPCLPCCTAPPTPGCAVSDCVRVGSLIAGCVSIPSGPCDITSYNDTVCQAIWSGADCTPCGGPSGPTTLIPTVRMSCSNLASGYSYTVKLYFVSSASNTTFISWTFTATGTTYTTSYQSFPTPNSTDQTWDIDLFNPCTIVVL